MRHRCRLLETGFASASANMALDEAILESVASGDSLPTLRFYGWSPAAVSLGYFQGAEEELDLEACRIAGIDIVRRITGGGAVLHDAELTYSIALPLDHPLASPSILDSYRTLCAPIVRGLADLGVAAAFAPINDVVCGERKISGNAQTRKRGVLLQHGTILLKVEPERMFSLLKVPREKAAGKMLDSIRSRVTSLSRELGREIGFAEAAGVFQAAFATSLSLALEKSVPSAAETRRAGTLAAEKFGDPGWIFRR